MGARRALDIRAGDTLRVWQKIQEGGKSRLQMFEGIVLARKHGREAGATITVRRVVGGIGVERIFPLYSPAIDRIELTKRGNMRRAKLYYIREKVAKEIRRQMRRSEVVAPTERVQAVEAVPKASAEEVKLAPVEIDEGQV